MDSTGCSQEKDRQSDDASVLDNSPSYDIVVPLGSKVPGPKRRRMIKVKAVVVAQEPRLISLIKSSRLNGLKGPNVRT